MGLLACPAVFTVEACVICRFEDQSQLQHISSSLWMSYLIPARSPTFQLRTLEPIFTTTPAPSWPGDLTPKVDIGGMGRSASR